MVSVGNNWYKIKIFNQQVNWATFILSGCAILGLELWRRKRISEQIEREVARGIAQAKLDEGSIIDQVVSGVDEIDWEDVLEDIT